MTFKIYDNIKRNFLDTLQYLRDLKANWFNPQNVYIAEKKIRFGSEGFGTTNMELSFIPLDNNQLITDILSLTIASNLDYPPPTNALDIPTFPKNSTFGQFLNIPPSQLLSALGPEGVILGVLNISNLLKPKVTPMPTGAPKTFKQSFSDGTVNTFSTDQMYKITHEHDPNPTQFLLLSTNFGISNYTAAHVGVLVRLGEYNAFNIVNGQLVWDVSKMTAELVDSSVMYYAFIDKGRKILANLVTTQDVLKTVAIIPQHLADGTPINVQEVINTYKYQTISIPAGNESGYQFFIDDIPQIWGLPRPSGASTIITFFIN